MVPSMQFRLPPAWFFKFPPDQQPLALPPPTESRTFAAPFAIPTHVYTGALDHKVPLTVAAVYATTVIAWNQVNRRRGFKAYGFSQTTAFKAFVIAHNVFLAIFSAFTFFGMLRALAHTWPGREHHLLGKFWPGLRASNGLAGAADALCKMHGPRGFGQHVAFNPGSNHWVAKDSLVALASTGYPDDSDVGRLWNEGLAFWGWWFYLSKFYEVFDTFIILAKGKRSSTLQTYHHTGAMMCMWAGIRYMSPPIWMFCFLNSGIHTMMYIYFTLSALSVKVPQRIKRTITTCQILQFLVGITFAGMHLFVTYDIPLSKTTVAAKTISSLASSLSSDAAAIAASVTTSAGLGAWLKQAALRAAGEEGLAENVVRQPSPFASSVFETLPNQPSSPQHGSGSTTWETVPCIDTSGQAFAIWLNLLYLAPLTGLFVRFFVKSYTRRGRASKGQQGKGRALKAIQDAAKGTDREIDSLGKAAEGGVDDVAREVNGHGNGNGKAAGSNGKVSGNGTPRSQRRVSNSINKAWERFEKGADDAPSMPNSPLDAAGAKAKAKTLRKKVSEGHSRLRSMFEDGSVGERLKNPPSQPERGRTMSDASIEEDVEKNEDAVSTSESLPTSSSQAVGEKTSEDALQHKSDMEQSWADVAKDAYPNAEAPSQPSSDAPSESEATTQAPQDPSEAQEKETQHQGECKGEDRSSTPTALHPSRSLSPQKSKLPRPTSREPPRERSPVKKVKSSSIPRPRLGTEISSSSQPSSAAQAPSHPQANAQASSPAQSEPSCTTPSEPVSSSSRSSSFKGEVSQSALPISPRAPNAAEQPPPSTSSSRSDDAPASKADERDGNEAQQQDQDGEAHEQSNDTNEAREQDILSTSSTDSTDVKEESGD